MYPLMWYELALFWRAPAFWAATTLHVTLLLLFVIVWGHGLPLANGGTPWQQFETVRWGSLIALAPWVVSRCAPLHKSSLVVFAAAGAVRPSRLVAARWLASSAALFTLSAAALPAMLLMQQIAAVPATLILAALAAGAGMLTFAAAVTNGSTVATRGRLSGWIASTAVCAAAGAVVPDSVAALPVWGLLAIGATVLLMPAANAWLRYLPEEVAA